MLLMWQTIRCCLIHGLHMVKIPVAKRLIILATRLNRTKAAWVFL